MKRPLIVYIVSVLALLVIVSGCTRENRAGKQALNSAIAHFQNNILRCAVLTRA
jgi:hypothetical protein